MENAVFSLGSTGFVLAATLGFFVMVVFPLAFLGSLYLAASRGSMRWRAICVAVGFLGLVGTVATVAYARNQTAPGGADEAKSPFATMKELRNGE